MSSSTRESYKGGYDIVPAKVRGAVFGAAGSFGASGPGSIEAGMSGLVLQDTPIKGVGMVNTSLDGSPYTKSVAKNSQPGGGEILSFSHSLSHRCTHTHKHTSILCLTLPFFFL